MNPRILVLGEKNCFLDPDPFSVEGGPLEGLDPADDLTGDPKCFSSRFGVKS